MLSPAPAAMVAATTDLAVLEEWVGRVAIAAPIEEIFAES